MPPTNLTPEVVALIIDQLLAERPSYLRGILVSETEPAARYTSVSREWQARVERKIFSELHLTPSRLADFGRIVCGARRGYVRRIFLHIVLPPYGEEKYSEFEDDEDQARNNEAFTSTFQSFFAIMHPWTQDEVHNQGLRLDVRFFNSPSDISQQPAAVRAARRAKARNSVRGAKDRFKRRYGKSYLRFIPSETRDVLLESVDAITSLVIHASYPRRMWPASCFQILAKLPRAQSAHLDLWDSEKKDLVLRKSARNHFAESIQLWPSSIQTLTLSYLSGQPDDETFSPPNILSGPSNDQDILSIHLRNFSQQLTHLSLDSIVISSSLFWPLSQSTHDLDRHEPYWPNLVSLSVSYIIATPSGNWLFDRPSDMTDEYKRGADPAEYTPEDELPAPEDMYPNWFRWAPLPLLNNMYRAAGRAAQNMPRLVNMWVRAQIPGPDTHWLKYEVIGGGIGGTVTWASTPPFVPEEDVMEIWREVGKDKQAGVEVRLVEALDDSKEPPWLYQARR